VHKLCRQQELAYTLEWDTPGLPYLTDRGELVEAVSTAIRTITGADTTLSTDGGTSDGRFIAPMGAQVVELGPCNATIHKVDEHVETADLDGLSAIYEQILVDLLG
jgi:succinyl-diaminopimelate desuccinylase